MTKEYEMADEIAASAAEGAAAATTQEPDATIASGATVETPATDLLSSDSIAAEGGEKPATDDKSTEEGEKPNEEDKPGEQDTPIEYELKLPEGVQADEEVMGQFKDILGEAKVPPETAQKLVDLHAATLKKVANAPYDTWRTIQKDWQDTIKADPEIGGANLSKSQASIAKLIDGFGADEAKAFRQALNFTGAGNNPAIVKALFRISQMHNEGSAIPGGKASTPPASAAEKVYPSLSKT